MANKPPAMVGDFTSLSRGGGGGKWGGGGGGGGGGGSGEGGGRRHGHSGIVFVESVVS